MKKYIFIPLVLLFLISCSLGRYTTNYYVFDYFENLDKPELHQNIPFDEMVWIQETEIPQKYSRRQIVKRHFGPKITYDQNNLWGDRLSDIIPSLLLKKITRYNMFKDARINLIKDVPNYVIETSLSQIEFSMGSDIDADKNINQARLAIEFMFRGNNEEKVLVHHNVDRTERVVEGDYENFVLVVNTILLNEMDNFLIKVHNYFSDDKIRERNAPEKEIVNEILPLYEEISDPSLGRLYIPAISETDNEPYYQVLDNQNEEVASERMGNSVLISGGIYNIRYGSGNTEQMIIRQEVEVIPRYRTIIEPDWGGLTVDIIDENRDYAKIRYEIFNATDGISYGDEFPKNEEIGEQKTVWILRPGLYKITINNESFNTIKDYTTVLVEEGKFQELRIVVGLDDDNNPTNMIGAGIISEQEGLEANRDWKFYSAIHGNVNIVSKNETDKDEQDTSITLAAQIENQFIYDKEPYHFVSRNITDLGTTKTSDTDFRLTLDELDWKNTFTYYFFQDVGLYARANISTHLLPRYSYFSENSDYILEDENGDTLSVHTDEKKVKTKPAFFPLNLKEGLGLNMRLLNQANVTANLRFGFGMEQDIQNDVFVKTDSDNIYRRMESEYKEGTEISLVGNLRLFSNITYTTDAYVLFPFDKEKDKTIEWENTINFKLFKYISLDYKLKLENRFINDEEEYIYNEHSLFLRVTYILN